MRHLTRDRILKSAIRVLRKQGVAGATLSEVADDAKVSKGGLLYHFPSKDALILGVLKESVEQFISRMNERRKSDTGAGGWLRAFITLSLPTRSARILDIIPTVLANVMSSDTNVGDDLRKIYQDNLDDWTKIMASDGLDEVTANLIQLAVDGLFFQEALGLRPLPDDQRSRLIQRLLEMTHVAKISSTTDGDSKVNLVAAR